ncbi:MAG TPA: hypothetical protein VHY48_02495 [Acidobacteriaceae bacterium]|jgi:hypothetical protein|nr:hypothetical protein [Acidobacteriaceae bacterium]
MKLRLLMPSLLAGTLLLAGASFARAQDNQPLEPPGVADALAGIASVPATHTAVTFDRGMLESMLGEEPVASLNGITFESFRYHESAFYIPENLAALRHDFAAAGWKHLVESNAGPRASTEPAKPITDMWFHFQGDEIDGVTVLVRARRQMNVIEVSGLLRPLDLVHLSGHFGIPKVDPNAVMVPAPPGR